MKRTYIDASVMIAAFRGDESTASRAMAVLDDPERALVVSDYLRLEVIPKPTFYNMKLIFSRKIYAPKKPPRVK